MTEAESLLQVIDAHPNESTPLLMLSDWLEENGYTESAEQLRSGCGWLGGDGDGGGGGGGDGGGGGYGYGDGDGGGDGDGDGGGGGGGDGGGYRLSRGYAMTRDGLYIICSPGGYYPYVRVGWCSRRDGMIEMRNCRVVKRFGTNAELAKLAQDGPVSSTQLLSASEVEWVAVGLVSRLIPCNPTAWKKECPKPLEEAVT